MIQREQIKELDDPDRVPYPRHLLDVITSSSVHPLSPVSDRQARRLTWYLFALCCAIVALFLSELVSR